MFYRQWNRYAALSRQARLRRHKTGLDYDGPYYPHIADGLVVLEDTDTGLRFDIADGLVTVASGSGAYVAWVPRVARGRLVPGLFVIGEA